MIYYSKRDCPFCRKSIAAQATICPYCRKDVVPVKRVSIGRVTLVGFGALVLLSGLLSAMLGGSSTQPSQRRVGCARAVKAKLRAPTTAKFEWELVRENGDTAEPFAYVTTGQVSSQNSFGAMLTTRFACYHDGQNSSPVKVIILDE